MNEQPISIPELLEARDRRAARQTQLLAQFQQTLVCFTMNIAGPVKQSSRIRDGFRLGIRWLRGQLRAMGISIVFFEAHTPATGCEAYFVLDCPAEAAKRLTCGLEDSLPVGRLFDMDVLAPGVPKLSRQDLGLPPRKCLLCEKDAVLCGRSRAHSVDQLREKTDQLLRDALWEDTARRIGALAEQSLLYEVCVTPKPGLVDRDNCGSHRDMDIFTFLASSAALSPYFRDCVRVGLETAQLSPGDTFLRLRTLGQLAEQTMFRATNDVNTHKGAIFILGLLCGAAGRLPESERTPDAIGAQCAAMTGGLIRDPLHPTTAGQQLLHRHGITGIRGEAGQGFPTILQTGLPALQRALARGLSPNDAGCVALLSIIAEAEDTNLIARSDRDTQKRIQQELKDLLAAEPFPGRDTLKALDRRFIEANLSPGGSADLLAASYFLHLLCACPSEP